MSGPWAGEPRDCPICLAEKSAEPEQDGEARFWACGECGSEFDYELVRQSEPSCQLGLPAQFQELGLSLRVEASMPPGVMALESPPGDKSSRRHVFLGTTIKRRPQ